MIGLVGSKMGEHIVTTGNVSNMRPVFDTNQNLVSNNKEFAIYLQPTTPELEIQQYHTRFSTLQQR